MQLVPDMPEALERAVVRLSGLEALCTHLSHDERDQFRSFMLGWLAHTAPTADWEDALGHAMESSNTWLRTTQGQTRHNDPDEPLS